MTSQHLRQLRHEASQVDDETFLSRRRDPWLVLLQGEEGDLEPAAVAVLLPRKGGVVTLGRHPANDVVAPWPSISRHHALLVIAGTQALVLDRGSLNGTFAAGQRLAPDVPRELRDGDELRFGHDLRGLFLSSRRLLARLRELPSAA